MRGRAATPRRAPGPVAIIGGGRVGRVIARACREAGVEVAGVVSRSAASSRAAARFARIRGGPADLPVVVAGARIVYLCVPDGEIAAAARQVAAAGAMGKDCVVAHASGSRDIGEMAALAPWPRAVCHPLMTFAHAGNALRHLPGSGMLIAGDAKAVRVMTRLARCLGVRPIAHRGDVELALYHAGAVLGCNYLVALESAAALALTGSGVVSQAEALRALLPIVRCTVANIGELGLAAALSGPIVRGDAAIIARHLQSLDAQAPAAARAYRALGEVTVALLAEAHRPPDDRVVRALRRKGRAGRGR